MKQFYSYIRVSTAKQKEFGVSPEVQRSANEQCARIRGITISRWFEDVQTAAKTGRKEFTKMVRLLKEGKADGVIIHKIDRSMRNLEDWLDIGRLVDAGTTVYFSHENLELNTRGGRLAADIQAVVAADFIRNLREETRKGFYGRLKQGIYPLGAPLGYVDNGKGGKVKTICPVKGPLVRQAFELYDTGRYSLLTLADEMYGRGFRNRNGGKVTRNGFSTILNNPFYCGLIRLRKTGESFNGIHEPLISVSLFERVGKRLQGRLHTKAVRHDEITFRRLLICGHCGMKLRGERQKGHVYYRCHTRDCPTKCVREEVVEEAIKDVLRSLSLSEEEEVYFSQHIDRKLSSLAEEWHSQRKAWQIQLGQLKTRIARLIDAYTEGTLEKDLFEDRKAALLLEQRELQEKLDHKKAEPTLHLERVREVVELANTAWLSYETATVEEKRYLLQLATSNRIVTGRNVVVEPSYPFSLLSRRKLITACDLKLAVGRTGKFVPDRHKPQALEHVIQGIYGWLVNHPQTNYPLYRGGRGDTQS